MGARLERPHQRLRAGEVHRALCMDCARKRERNEGRSHHSRCVGKVSFGEGLGQSLGKVGCTLGDYETASAEHRHLLRPERPRYEVSVRRPQSTVQYFLFIG
jgi:hypothetical protein